MPKIDLDKCKGCGICVDACLNNAITIENKKAAIEKNRCMGCELCISTCPNGAIIFDISMRRYPYQFRKPSPQYPSYYYPGFRWKYYQRFRSERRGRR